MYTDGFTALLTIYSCMHSRASLLFPGDPLVTQAEDDEGVSGAAAPLVVWLLAFSLSAVWNVVYAVYLLFRNDTWGRYEWMGWAELFRKFRKVR